MRLHMSSWGVVLAVALGGCATAPSSTAPPPAARAGWVARADLPADFVVGDARSPLAWPGDAAAQPMVLAERLAGQDSGGTMLKVASHDPRPLKYDLYISPDGKRFQYTSTCVLIPQGAGFESWPYPIAAFALGHVREVKAMTCE